MTRFPGLDPEDLVTTKGNNVNEPDPESPGNERARRRFRQPDPASKTRTAARWLRDNPTATPRVAADLHGITEGAVRTAWCRSFPGESMAERLQRPAPTSST